MNAVAETPTLDRTLDALVGAHFGVIESLDRVVPEPDDVPLCVYGGQLSNTLAYSPQGAPRIASGAGFTEEQVRWACVGEAIERYSAALIPPGAVVQALSDELSGRVVVPWEWALFHWSQRLRHAGRFPFGRWTPGQPLGWTRGTSLVTGKDVWLPASFVFQPYTPAAHEVTLAPTYSTGLACHSDWNHAVLRGLCEVLERDAIGLAWLGQIALPACEQNWWIEDAAASEIVATLSNRGFRWRLLDATTEFQIPVAVAIVSGHSALGPIVACGSASHPERSAAATKALVEACHCRMYVKSLLRESPNWCCGSRFENVTSFADHARLYSSHPEFHAALNSWWNASKSDAHASRGSGISRNTADPSQLADEIVVRLCQRGYEPFVVDVTAPDVRPLGLRVARVIVPGLQPLHGHHRFPHLGEVRLGQLRRVFGPQARQPWRWNRWPHPFA